MTEYEAYAAYSVVVSSIVFAAVLVFIYRKYLAPAVAGAQHTRNEEIAAAQRRRDEAVAELGRIRSEQDTLQKNLDVMLERARTDAERERETILADARSQGEHAVHNAQGELDRARHTGLHQVRQSLLKRAVGQARERAAREIDAGLDAKIVMQFAHSLNRSEGNSFAVVGES